MVKPRPGSGTLYVYSLESEYAPVDRFEPGELATVLSEDELGWVTVLNPRGVVGRVHRVNVRYVVRKVYTVSDG